MKVLISLALAAMVAGCGQEEAPKQQVEVPAKVIPAKTVELPVSVRTLPSLHVSKDAVLKGLEDAVTREDPGQMKDGSPRDMVYLGKHVIVDLAGNPGDLERISITFDVNGEKATSVLLVSLMRNIFPEWKEFGQWFVSAVDEAIESGVKNANGRGEANTIQGKRLVSMLAYPDMGMVILEVVALKR